MKYYSEVLNKNFDTIKELQSAESAFKLEEMRRAKELEKAAQERKIKEQEIADDKKKLVKAIDEAKAKVDEAQTIVRSSYQEYNDLVRIAKEQGAKKVAEAKTKLNEASRDYYSAIKVYNDKYGVYQKTITNKDAVTEFNKLISSISDFWNLF